MMGYLAEMYGKRSKDWIEGFIAAVDSYSVWRNGAKWIGSPEKLASEVIREVKEECGDGSLVD
jgi:hypothetical protein